MIDNAVSSKSDFDWECTRNSICRDLIDSLGPMEMLLCITTQAYTVLQQMRKRETRVLRPILPFEKKNQQQLR